jgi:acyl transferase domain-containing protein/acyl carrier protein
VTESAELSQLKRALVALKEMRGRLDAVEKARTEPIAIIGIGCRFPGGANSPEAFWQLLQNGVDAVGEVPASRWDADALYADEPETPGKINTRYGAFLADVDQFDPYFFGISPHEAAFMDPQQRLLLQVAWEALENAGQTRQGLAGSDTAVFVGVHSHSQDYYLMQVAAPERLAAYTGTGTAHNVLSGRLSYLFDWQGPSMVVDTACSSSLVALHEACQSLRLGECGMALAAGVNLILSPQFSIAAAKMHMLAPDGRCKAFDARADGFGRGEGCGVVVLKRLSEAQAAGDPIWAVIRGSAVNQDGNTNGLTAPNGLSQQRVIRQALANARVQPEQIDVVETHGTGTVLGDPIEIEALAAVVGANRAAQSPCYLGSVKTNVAHLEGAAGIAGVIKAALTLHHRQVPPVVHFQTPNPHLALPDSFVIPTALTPLPEREAPYAAGVSSFGWSGTNAHVILQEAPASEPIAQPEPEAEALYQLILSAHTPEALRETAAAHQTFLQTSHAPLHDVAYTTAVRRTHHEHRLVMVGANRAELTAQLEAFLQGEERPGLATGRVAASGAPGVVFVFPGQGSQWLGMGRDLLASEPVFREAIEQCEAAMRPFVDWSLTAELTADPATFRLDEIDVVQPTLFAVQVALAALWRAWGIAPDAVIGHSMGEVAAAHAAGALSLEDAASIICQRSKLLRRVSGQGAMAVVGLSMAETAVRLQGYEDCLSIAVSNSPRSTVVSGDPAALDELLAILQADEVFCRAVKVDVASHSPQMDPLQAELEALLQNVRPRAATIPMYSTVLGSVVAGESLNAAYWMNNLRQPVLFTDTVQKLIQTNHLTFVEISAHPILLPAVGETLVYVNQAGLTVHSLRRDEPARAQLLAALGALVAAGHEPDWRVLYPSGGTFVRLPGLPWQQERYWLDYAGKGTTAVGPWQARQEAHPLLGWRLETAVPGTHIWQVTLNAHTQPALFANGATFPPLACLEMAHAALAALYQDQPLPGLRHVQFKSPIGLPAAGDLALQLTIAQDHTLRLDFRQDGAWQLALLADIVPGVPDLAPASGEPVPIATWLGDALPTVAAAVTFVGAAETAVTCQSTAGDENGRVNVTLLNKSGQRVAHLTGLERQAPGISSHVADWLYELAWVRRETAAAPAADPALWIVLADQAGFAAALAGHWRAQGAEVVLVRPGTALQKVAAHEYTLPTGADVAPLLAVIQKEASRPCRGIVHGWSLDLPATENLTAVSLVASQAKSSVSALKLVQAIAQTEWPERPRLWFVTQGAQAVADDKSLALAQTPLWGLGRVVAEEHPEFWGGLVDLAAAAVPTTTAPILAHIVQQPDGENQFAIRQQEQYVARFQALDTAVRPATPLTWKPDASYLVTGGLGGVGYVTAQWLARQGARHLVLLGRTPLPPRSEWSQVPPEASVRQRIDRLIALERLGTTVHYAAVDVADEAALTTWLDTYRRENWPPICGVFHAAVLIDDQLLLNLDADSLQNVLLPKMVGGWLLHQQLPDLDYFVLYSSLGAVWGQVGQGNYAAANTFLDGLAHYRQMHGRPGLSVNWGAWVGLGLAAESGTLRTIAELKTQGIEGFAADQGLAAQQLLLETAVPQAAVIPVNWQKYQQAQEGMMRGERPFLKDVITQLSATPAVAASRADSFYDQLADAEPGQRQEMLETYLQKQVATILKMAPEQINRGNQLGNYGFDSLMAIKLRNRLEQELHLTLSATLVWNYPTIGEMSVYLARKMNLPLSDEDAAAAAESAAETPAEEALLDDILTGIESLSDEDALNALLNP